jgi:hypothetical protein
VRRVRRPYVWPDREQRPPVPFSLEYLRCVNCKSELGLQIFEKSDEIEEGLFFLCSFLFTLSLIDEKATNEMHKCNFFLENQVRRNRK